MFSIHQIVKGHSQSVYFVIPVLFIFCGLPLFLDEIVGRLTYDNETGFALAAADEMTNIIYCLYIAVVPLILLWFGKPKVAPFYPTVTSATQTRSVTDNRRIKVSNQVVGWAILVSPIVLAIFSPEPGQYLTFSSTLRFSEDYKEFHQHLTAACNLAILAGGYLIAVTRPKVLGRWPSPKTMLPVIFWMLIAVWIHGKRNIIVIMAVLLLMALRYRGILRGVKAYILICVSLIVVMSYSSFFQIHTKRVVATAYENFRIDFGRDHTIKMTIFAELHPTTMQILEYRGQSILFLFTAFVPRTIWPEKPLPYAQYFTSALFFSNPRLWGWAMTTSWLEEAIANFSWLGMLIGPFCIGIVCRVGDASKSSLVQILTPLIASLLLVVEAIAFAPLLLLWFYSLVRDK